MKAIQIAAYGDIPTAKEIHEPPLGPGDVLIRVAGAAINPLDLKISAGYLHEVFPVQFPYTLGTDISGEIVTTGDSVTGWKVGDQVVARLDPKSGGGLAELAVIPADQLASAPSSIPLFLAAGAVTAAATAWQALTEVADVQAGQRVLVHAGAGGVGSFAIQLAQKLGAHVIATASKSGLRIAADLGADEVIDYIVAPLEAQVSDIDVVIDTIGGQVEEQSLKVLRSDGLLVALPTPPDGERASARGIRAEFVFHESDAARLSHIVQLLDDGVTILLDHRVDLKESPEALNYLAEGHAKGKVIVVPSGMPPALGDTA